MEFIKEQILALIKIPTQYPGQLTDRIAQLFAIYDSDFIERSTCTTNPEGAYTCILPDGHIGQHFSYMEW